jgi:hypothetical protein
MALIRTGYGYGYGPYSNGYTDEEKPRHFYDAIKKNYKQKEKKIIVDF